VDNPAARSEYFYTKDLHPFIEAPATTRWLRDAIAGFKGTQKTIILVSDAAGANRAGKSGCSRLPLPDMTELNQVLSKQLEQNRTRRLTTEAREKL